MVMGGLAADPASRNYHSAAILLPDGRVLSSGGEDFDGQGQSSNPNETTVTIYEPPYLFANPSSSTAPETYAARPQIMGSGQPSYGSDFSICTRVVLLSLASFRGGLRVLPRNSRS